MISSVRPLPLLVLLASVITSPAHAAKPLEVSVAGRIKAESPICMANLPKAMEYGVIPLEKIKPDGVTLLDEKTFSFKVICSGQTKFTVQFIDNRHGSAVDNAAFLAEVAKTLPGVGPNEAFGLGLDSTGKKIGAMFLNFTSIRYRLAGFTSYPAQSFYRQGEAWVSEAPYGVRYQTPYTFAQPNGPVPLAISWAHAYVTVLPVLDSSRLDLTKKIEAGGRLTLEISQI
jgi:hypothetical protein